jgi:hypothetical protein
MLTLTGVDAESTHTGFRVHHVQGPETIAH